MLGLVEEEALEQWGNAVFWKDFEGGSENILVRFYG